MEKYILGLDIGGTNIRIAMSTQKNVLDNYEKIPRTSVLSGNNAMEHLAVFIETYIDKYGAGVRPSCVVLGFPATIDRAKTTILQAPNIPGLDGIPAKDILQKSLNTPVYIEKDVNLLFYNDAQKLNLPDTGVGIGIYVGTGIGNALFFDGKPYSGKHGVAGELGHIPKSGSSHICGCGNYGCSECYGSGTRLVEIKNKYFPTTDINDLWSEHGYCEVLQSFIDEIACTIAAEINILDPDHIVLGGGVLNMKDFPLDTLKDAIYKHTRKPYPADDLCLYFAKDQQESGVYGALAMGWKLLEE